MSYQPPFIMMAEGRPAPGSITGNAENLPSAENGLIAIMNHYGTMEGFIVATESDTIVKVGVWHEDTDTTTFTADHPMIGKNPYKSAD